MSAAAAAEPVADAPKKGKKKLIIIVAAALILAGGGGGGSFFMAKKKAEAAALAAADEDGEDAAPVHKAKDAHKSAPTYVPLDPFVVNLADKDTDRFAQVGVTLEVDDAKFADQMKTYMPAIRNGILLALAQKTSTELLQRSGKEALAEEIMREAARPMGIEFDDDEDEATSHKAKASDEEEAPAKKKKKKKKKKPMHNPISNVLFSTFIIQ
jgi:flagellar FliL protein